ncbi:MAG: MATE family efflux transporter [Lachnospiraceae bacterium]|nr:MATE family efflux transporter [Lachnospiraceae bacterium]
MEKAFIFNTVQEVRFGKVLGFIIPTYLTSCFNTLYTIVDGIFVASYVGTNALAAINIVYPIVNVLTGIALLFATGGSAIAALHIGAGRKESADRAFSVSILFSITTGIFIALLILVNLSQVLQILGATSVTMEQCKIYSVLWLVGTPAVIGKELFTYFIRVDGSPTYSFFTALAGGVLNIVLDYILIGYLHMGVLGAALATVLGLVLSVLVGVYYFIRRKKILHFTTRGLSIATGVRCAFNGVSEFVNQLAIAITTTVFNRTAMIFAGEDGIAAISIIMYLQFIFLGVYFGYSMGISPLLGYAYGDHKFEICKKLEKYSYRFFTTVPMIIYVLTFLFAPVGVSFFADAGSKVYHIAVSGMRLYGLGFLFSGFNIFAAVRMMAYGKGHLSGTITFLRSFALLLLFLTILPIYWGMNGIWFAVPMAEILTLFVSFLIVLDSEKYLR